ncbi:MAG TPA: hypothetical protein VLH18_00020 [Candidatus Limnocylindrales bacterium]|nr:hypothetical protein [Candidatus Limnocylindrales bacterium]
MNKTIAKEMLPELWARLSSCGTLFLPLREGPVVLFQPWYEEAEVDLEAVNTVVSPKDLFLPRDEAYLHYRRKGQKLEFIEAGDPGPVIAFGVHPCDLRAAAMLDRVFLEQDPVDDLYQKRRDNTTVVVLACREPDPFCFCRDFGVDPADAPRADIMAFFPDSRSYWSRERLRVKHW